MDIGTNELTRPFRIPKKSTEVGEKEDRDKMKRTRAGTDGDLRSPLVATSSARKNESTFSNRIVPPAKRKATTGLENSKGAKKAAMKNKNDSGAELLENIIENMVNPPKEKRNTKIEEVRMEHDEAGPSGTAANRPQNIVTRRLTRDELEKRQVDNTLCYAFLKKEGLMERLLGHKMLTGRVDSHVVLGYMPIESKDWSPTRRKKYLQRGGSPFENYSMPGGNPLNSAPAEERKGPKTPPGSPGQAENSSLLSSRGVGSASPTSPPPPPPPPEEDSSKDIDTAGLIAEMAEVTKLPANQLSECLGKDLQNAVKNVDRSVLLNTLKDALRKVGQREEVTKESSKVEFIVNETTAHPNHDSLAAAVEMEIESDKSKEEGTILPPPPPAPCTPQSAARGFTNDPSSSVVIKPAPPLVPPPPPSMLPTPPPPPPFLPAIPPRQMFSGGQSASNNTNIPFPNNLAPYPPPPSQTRPPFNSDKSIDFPSQMPVKKCMERNQESFSVATTPMTTAFSDTFFNNASNTKCFFSLNEHRTVSSTSRPCLLPQVHPTTSLQNDSWKKDTSSGEFFKALPPKNTLPAPPSIHNRPSEATSSYAAWSSTPSMNPTNESRGMNFSQPSMSSTFTTSRNFTNTKSFGAPKSSGPPEMNHFNQGPSRFNTPLSQTNLTESAPLTSTRPSLNLFTSTESNYLNPISQNVIRTLMTALDIPTSKSQSSSSNVKESDVNRSDNANLHCSGSGMMSSFDRFRSSYSTPQQHKNFTMNSSLIANANTSNSQVAEQNIDDESETMDFSWPPANLDYNEPEKDSSQDRAFSANLSKKESQNASNTGANQSMRNSRAIRKFQPTLRPRISKTSYTRMDNIPRMRGPPPPPTQALPLNRLPMHRFPPCLPFMRGRPPGMMYRPRRPGIVSRGQAGRMLAPPNSK